MSRAEQEDAQALHLAGVAAVREGDLARAAGLMDRAAKLGVREGMAAGALALVHRNRIEVHRRLLQPRTAILAGRAALGLVADDAVTLNNLALAHFDALEIDAALDCYGRAIALAPEDAAPRFGRGEVLLAIGDYARGWEGYGWRFRLPGVAAPVPAEVLGRRRRWGGRKIGGTLLLVADQGFGDVVQFCRYIPWAASRCSRLVVAASAEMRPVIAQFPQVAACLASWDRVGDFSAWAVLSDLPGLAGAWADSVAAEVVPYLAAGHEARIGWQARLDELCGPALQQGGVRRVGLVWAGRANHPFDFARSASLAALAPLGGAAGVCWVGLQMGGGRGAGGGAGVAGAAGQSGTGDRELYRYHGDYCRVGAGGDGGYVGGACGRCDGAAVLADAAAAGGLAVGAAGGGRAPGTRRCGCFGSASWGIGGRWRAMWWRR